MNARYGYRSLVAALVTVAMVAIVAVGGCDRDDGELKTLDPDGSPDLVVAKEVDLNGNRTPFEGAVIRYLITVGNDGTWDADAVVVRDSLPAQVTLVAADAEQGEYDAATHRWHVGIVPPDSVFTLSLTVRVNNETRGQVVTNTARVVAMDPADDAPADNQATVLFAVLNGPPIAVDDAYECLEGDTLIVAAPGILANDHDAEGEAFELREEPVSAPWHGELVLHADGGFEYRHDGSEAAVDSFTYLITDESAEPDTGLVRLAILPVNDAPVAVDDLFQVNEGGTVTGSVLGNDSDPEDDELTAILAEGPSHAAAFDLADDGSFTYTHDGNEESQDSFFYFANDGTDISGLATVVLTLIFANDPPTVSDIPDQDIDEGASFAVIRLDDYVDDPDHQDSELIWTHSGAIDLVVTVDADTRVATVATPDDEWSGSEIITLRATDPGGAWDQDAAVFQVRPVNDPPYIRPIPAQTVAEGGAFAALDLDLFVTDPDHLVEELEWTWQGGGPLVVEIDADRFLRVAAPDPDWFGQRTITVHVEDPGGLADERNVAFTITPVNDAPVTSPLPGQIINAGGTFLSIDLDDYVTDVDNDDEDMFWVYSGNTDLLVNISDRVATVRVPDSEWVGTETITFTVTDPGDLSAATEAVFEVR